jgi:hypothetical protein
MKIYINEDIRTVSKRAWKDYHYEFMDKYGIYTNGKRNILAQRCIFNTSKEGEVFLAILGELCDDLSLDFCLPSYVTDHLNIYIEQYGIKPKKFRW